MLPPPKTRPLPGRYAAVIRTSLEIPCSGTARLGICACLKSCCGRFHKVLAASFVIPHHHRGPYAGCQAPSGYQMRSRVRFDASQRDASPVTHGDGAGLIHYCCASCQKITLRHPEISPSARAFFSSPVVPMRPSATSGRPGTPTIDPLAKVSPSEACWIPLTQSGGSRFA